MTMSTTSSSSCCSCRITGSRRSSSTTSASFVGSRINNDSFNKGTTNPSSLSTTSSFDIVQSQFYDLMHLKNIVINKARQQINTQTYVIDQQNDKIVDTTSTERSSSSKDDDDTEEQQESPRENQKEIITGEKKDFKNTLVSSGSVITVPCDQYETLMRQLEVERIEHAKTKTKCEELADHLDFARGQIEILQKQLQREKDNFRQVLGSVQESNIVGEERKDHLETRVRELHTDNQQLSRRLRSKDTEMEKLQEALAKEKSSQNRRIIDMEVRRCQENYISSMLATKDTATGRSQLPAKKCYRPPLNTSYRKTKLSS